MPGIVVNPKKHARQFEERQAKAPKTESWWLNPERFYAEARQRFPEDSGSKSHEPVRTFGGYERSLTSLGRERLRDQRDREELR